MNELHLTATIVERDVIRYSPAGIPILSVVLGHVSEQMEAGYPRRTEFEMPAMAAGDVSGKLQQVAAGEVLQFRGFLAPKGRNSKSLVFHIVDFDIFVTN